MLPCKLCQSKPVKKAYWNCPNVGCSLCETLLNAKEWNILMSDFRRPELVGIDKFIEWYQKEYGFHPNKHMCWDLIKTIFSKFTAPEAKQREVKWPEKDCLPLELQHHKESGLFNEIRNSAIDACKKAYEEAQPASSVNAEVVEALRGLVDDEECSFDHHGYCQTHFSGSMPCLMEKARKALKKVGYD